MTEGEVTVEYGVNSQTLFMDGKTIRELVGVARNLWVLPEQLNIRLNDETVTNMETVLRDGDLVELIKPAGDKGRQ